MGRGNFFRKNLFRRTNFWENVWGDCSKWWGLIIRSRQGGRNFTKCIFQWSEHCKSETFSQTWWDSHLKKSLDHSIELWKDLPLRLIVKRFQRLCHVMCGINILFETLTPEIGGLIWKSPIVHNASVAGNF